MAFMSGDLFPISLEDNTDHLQVDACALAAMETSISFELEQLSNGQYVASLRLRKVVSGCNRCQLNKL